jgi:hypothetical protein
MFNFSKNEFNSNNDDNVNSFENNIAKSLRILTIMTVILACSRLLSFEIMTMIGELMTAVMIYFYSQSRTKCMAIFCMINGAIGLIYAVLRIFITFSSMKANWFNLYSTLLFSISLYALMVYSLICYFAYFGIIENNQSTGGFFPTSSSYGAILTDNKATKSFVPFDGKGTIVG